MRKDDSNKMAAWQAAWCPPRPIFPWLDQVPGVARCPLLVLAPELLVLSHPPVEHSSTANLQFAAFVKL